MLLFLSFLLSVNDFGMTYQGGEIKVTTGSSLAFSPGPSRHPQTRTPASRAGSSSAGMPEQEGNKKGDQRLPPGLEPWTAGMHARPHARAAIESWLKGEGKGQAFKGRPRRAVPEAGLPGKGIPGDPPGRVAGQEEAVQGQSLELQEWHQDGKS